MTQAADFHALRPLIIEYADAYRALLADLLRSAEAGVPTSASHGPVQSLRQLLAIDTVALSVPDHRGRRREAALVAPTHPLRALWLATWAHVSEEWLDKARRAPRELVPPAREALLRSLAPIGFPAVLPLATGRLLMAVDSLHPFWTLYAPTHEEDPRGLVGDVCAALGLPEPAATGSPITGAALGARVQRYLVQHPYVRSLTLNVFNPGRATAIADMLVTLQASPELADLRFDVRLFAPDADAPGLGEALTELMSPMASTTSREVDAFATPTGSHLRPKLAIATLPSAEFRKAPENYPAHISLLLDVFPAEEVGAAPAVTEPTMVPVHGLCQDFDLEYQDDETVVRWSRQPRHGHAEPVGGAEELTDLLSTLPELVSRATATVATGEVGTSLRPVITLALDSDHRSLLHQVHEVSDWVMTIDRNLGIEFFDHGGAANRPEYLIDQTPEATGAGSGHRLIITSRSSTELEALLKPVLEQYGLPATAANSLAVLSQLMSLSGRLALKLLSAPNQRAEAFGLALSRMYLEHQGVFANQVVIPLDAHLDLYRAIARSADGLADEVSFKRTDLALFDLDHNARTVTCRLVEVKCYRQTGGVSGLTQLKRSIAEQIAQSYQVIAHHFDPDRWQPADRPDRPIKTREFVALLEFYLDRAVRHRAMDADAEQEARALLRSLHAGYQLRFTRTALIFDFDRDGTDAADVEDGIEYHRIGADLIRQLVAAAGPDAEDERGVSPDDTTPAPAGSVARLAARRDRAPSVPTLARAAFIAPTRDRTVTLATLRADDGWYDPGASVPAESALTQDAAITADLSVGSDSAVAPPPVPATTVEQPPPLVDDRVAPASQAESGQPLAYDVLLGHAGDSPQYGILGEHLGRRVAIDLNQTHTISLFGVQGGGKSYTLGTVVEMASLPIANINRLPRPLATVIFHYSPTMDYAPEFTTMVAANTDEGQVELLRQRYGAQPQGLSDVVLLVPRDKVAERKAEFPGIEVRALTFAAAELQASHWRFLMGAVGNQATYVRQVGRVMKSLRGGLTLDGLRHGIEATTMPDHLKTLALGRLDLAAEYIDDSFRVSELARPGRLIIVDLRDEFIEKDEALGLFVVLLQLFADAKYRGEDFNKLVVFDEAHKYIDSPDLVAGLVEVVREMRHKATSIMVASQDPPSVPIALIELSTQIIMHKFNSPAWLKHIQKANAALSELSPEKMAQLGTGEAYVWSSKATDDEFSHRATKIRCRPRVTQHGGATKTAVT